MYYVNNREKILAKQAIYREANREKRNAHMRKKRSDPIYNEARLAKVRRTGLNWKQYLAAIKVPIGQKRAANRLRGQVLRALRRTNSYISKHIGSSGPALRAHLESQFTGGMNWENYGKLWCIDHIKPLVDFDLTDNAQYLVCAHYSNMRPILFSESITQGGPINRRLVRSRLYQAKADSTHPLE